MHHACACARRWEESDGGELRLFPFPLAPINVPPVFDRLAIFNSTEMLHRVLPSNATRVCLSVWFSRDVTARPLSLPRLLPPDAVEAVGGEQNANQLRFLLQPDMRKLLSKVSCCLRLPLSPHSARSRLLSHARFDDCQKLSHDSCACCERSPRSPCRDGRGMLSETTCDASTLTRSTRGGACR